MRSPSMIDVQFNPANNDWPTLQAAVLAAERAGFDTTWVFDHFDGTLLDGDRPMLECVALASALAVATSTAGRGRIGIGTLVANVANRHPAVFAEAVASIDRISEGRHRVGIGAGTAPGSRQATEHDRRGIALTDDREQRHARVVEQIEALRTTCPTVPVIVGVNTVELAEIAGAHADGINVGLTSPRAARQVDAARTAAAGSGRPFEVSAYVVVDAAPGDPSDLDSDIAARADDLGADRLVLTYLGRI